MRALYTITTSAGQVRYAGNGVTTAFPVTFQFFEASTLRVRTAIGAAVTDEVLGSDYMVSGGAGSTGVVTFVTAPPSGTNVIVDLNMPITQETIDLAPNGPLPAEDVEQGFDRIVTLVKQLSAVLDTVPQMDVTFNPDAGPAPVLPPPENGKLLAGNAAGTGWENAAISDLSVTDTPVLLGTSAVGQVLQNSGSTYRNVRMAFSAELFGIKGDDATDNTSLINNAISTIAAFTPRGGGELYFPPGLYRISGPVVVTSNGIILAGAGPASASFVLTNATADGIVFGSTSVQVEGCAVNNMGFSSTVTKSAGAYVRFRRSLHCGSTNCNFSGGFRHFEFNACYQTVVNEHRATDPKSATGVGLYFEGNRDALGGGVRGSDVYLQNIAMAGPSSGQPAAGVYIKDFSGVWMDTVGSVQMGNGLLIAPAAGDVVEHLFTSRCAWDSGDANGILLNPSGGTIRRWTSVSDWCASNATNGLVTGGTGEISDIHMVSPTMRNNVQNGMSWAKGSLTVMAGIRIVNPKIAGNSTTVPGTYHGVVMSAVNKWSIIGGKIGPDESSGDTQGYNIVLDSAPTNYLISGVDVAGGTTGTIVGHAASSSKIIRDCLGYVNANSGLATSLTTDGSGDVTITHGLSGTPTKVFAQPQGASSAWYVIPHTIGATTFKVRVFTALGAALSTDTNNIAWEAKL